MPDKKNTGTEWLLFPLFVLVSFVLYHSTIQRSFSADDFLVLQRVGLHKTIFIHGFFRPLSDISLYFNFLLGGFNPAGYYLFSIVLHGINSFLLFLFCSRWSWTENGAVQKRYALLAALLFLCYPFHNECIVWVLGRASAMAGSFGLLSLVILVSRVSEAKKIVLICLCYFIGLASYESILMLPLLVLVVLYKAPVRRGYRVGLMTALTFTLIVHLITRFAVSGAMAGGYGEGFLTQQISRYLFNIFKVAGRLFIPPFQNPAAFSVLAGVVMTGCVIVFISQWRGRTKNREYLAKMIILIMLTCTIPVLSGVSTKTSESDRFLYFPSFFLCAWIAFCLVHWFTRFRTLAPVVILISSYFIFCLQQNNAHWEKASDITRNILQGIESIKNAKKIYVINLPDEYEGAFIFRQGLKDALVIDQADSSRVVIVNQLLREQMLVLPPVIHPVERGDETLIAPVVTLSRSPWGMDSIWRTGNEIHLLYGKESRVLYWNHRELKKVGEAAPE